MTTESDARVEQAFERLTAAVGVSQTMALGVIDARQSERFAFAVGHTDSRFLADRSTEAEVPPLFVPATMEWSTGPMESELRADGSPPSATSGLPLEGLRLMGAGQDLEWHARIRTGMSLNAEFTIADVRLKHGKQGSMVIITIRRDYVAEDGSPLLTCLETVIGR